MKQTKSKMKASDKQREPKAGDKVDGIVWTMECGIVTELKVGNEIYVLSDQEESPWSE